MAGSEALLASQINGGGCLAPPTPKERPSDVMAKTLNTFFGNDTRTSYEKFNKELDPSLAFRTSTLTSMVTGVGGFINPGDMQAHVRPRPMGVVMKNGRMMRLNRPRNMGEPAFWQTSSERAVDYHHNPDTITFD